MASWNNDQDIARDMDVLSGITKSNGKVKSYTSWGRGHIPLSDASNDVFSPSTLQEKTHDEFKWFPERNSLKKLPDSIGRGKRLEILKESIHMDKELEVQEQLRAVMGPGHSNAFIEKTFKQRLKCLTKTDSGKLLGAQFVDPETVHSANSSNDKGGSDSFPANSETTVPVNSELESCSNLVVPEEKRSRSRRKPRRYRNAVLESLEKLDGLKSSSNECTSTYKSSENKPIFGSKNSSIPPAGYHPFSSLYCVKNSEDSFNYKESDFPTLL